MADPVADFLAREQDILAEIEGDAPPAIVPDVADAPPQAPADLADEFGGLAVAQDPVSVDGGDSGVDLAGLAAAEPPATVPVMNGTSTGSSKGPSPVPSMPRIEAENIRRWREDQKVMLEKKDEEEDKKKAELRATAAKELEDWYKQRDATLVGTREANRKAEEEHLAAFGREQGESAQWDEIVKLCEAKAQKGGKDVSRLKSLLLHLKEQNSKK